MAKELTEYEAYKQLDSLFGGEISHPEAVNKVDVISTGSPWLDKALRVGGWPRGRLIQLAGKEASGKTVLAMLAIARWQSLDLENCAAFLDAEFTYDPVWGKSLGIDNDRLFYVKSNEAKILFEGLVGRSKKNKNTGKVTKIAGLFDMIADGQVIPYTNPITKKKVKMNLGKLGVIVLDSVAHMNTPTDIESEVGKQNMALLARFLSVELKKLTPGIGHSNVAMICINQVRVDLGKTFGNPESTPGGKALKHACSVMVEIGPRYGADNESKNEYGDVLGRRIRAKVSKNKLGPPSAPIEYFVEFGTGLVNIEDELIEAGQQVGYIQKPSVRSYVFAGEKYTSRADALEGLKKNLDIHIDGIRSAYLDNFVPADDSVEDDVEKITVDNPFEGDEE